MFRTEKAMFRARLPCDISQAARILGKNNVWHPYVMVDLTAVAVDFWLEELVTVRGS